MGPDVEPEEIPPISDSTTAMARVNAEQMAEMVRAVFGPSGAYLDEAKECWAFEQGEYYDPRVWWQGWYLALRQGLLVPLQSGRFLAARAGDKVTRTTLQQRVLTHLAMHFEGASFTRGEARHAMETEDHEKPMSTAGFYKTFKSLVASRSLQIVPARGVAHEPHYRVVHTHVPAEHEPSDVVPPVRPAVPRKPRRRREQPAEPTGTPDLPPWAPDSMKFDAEAGRPWAHLPRTPDEDDATTMACNLIFSEGESLWRMALIDPMAQTFCPRKAGQVSMFSEARKTCATLEDARKHDVWNGTRAANAVAAGREMGIFEPVDPEHAGLGDPHRIVPMDVSMWDKDYLARLEREYNAKRRMVR